MINNKTNNKINNTSKTGKRLVSFLAIIFISAAYFSFIPFDIIFSTTAKSCCSIYTESDSVINEYAGNGCSCCSGVCRCAFKDRTPGELPFNGFFKVHVNPDLSASGDNFFTEYNIFALIFKDSPPHIDTVDFNSKVPIYRLNSSMLC